MTKYLPTLPLVAGLALVVWRPEWTSVATLAILALSAGAWALWQAQQDMLSVSADLEALRVKVAAVQREVSERLTAVENKAQRAIEAAERPSQTTRGKL